MIRTAFTVCIFFLRVIVLSTSRIMSSCHTASVLTITNTGIFFSVVVRMFFATSPYKNKTATPTFRPRKSGSPCLSDMNMSPNVTAYVATKFLNMMSPKTISFLYTIP